jgi:arylsulfatase
MATFAAMVEQMDDGVGRVVAALEPGGQLENTMVLFCSDNGACAEWDPYGFDVSSGPRNILHTGAELDRMGQAGTYHSYGSAWANLSNTPWRLYKHYMHEGGISTPSFVHWPAGMKSGGRFSHQPWHFIDVLPTLARLAGAQAPPGIAGEDMSALLGGGRARRGPIYWEHEGSRAVRDGKWKITAVHPRGEWELYDIEADRSELHNLASKHPRRVREMAVAWDRWARANQVVPWIWEPQWSQSSG